MMGAESGLLGLLGKVFLALVFIVTIGVAIKVLMGGSSGSGNKKD
jgi:hypothetical protein